MKFKKMRKIKLEKKIRKNYEKKLETNKIRKRFFKFIF